MVKIDEKYIARPRMEGKKSVEKSSREKDEKSRGHGNVRCRFSHAITQFKAEDFSSKTFRIPFTRRDQNLC